MLARYGAEKSRGAVKRSLWCIIEHATTRCKLRSTVRHTDSSPGRDHKDNPARQVAVEQTKS